MRQLKRLQLAFLAAVALLPILAVADAVPVELRQSGNGWQLLRGGEPYFIRGAGGTHSLQQLADAGANSIRTWDAEGIDELLDEAHSLGLSVTVGIWLGHERHGFDYSDAVQVAEQLERVRKMVLRYRDHPAVLLWGLGDEMEGFESGNNPAIWQAVNNVASMVKELDPNHPTMTVTAEIGGDRVVNVHKNSPAIDIHGINSYGGATSLNDRLRAAGATKPFIITEFGPPGEWEAAKNSWGAPLEPTSTEKAAFYRKSYEQGVLASDGQALGSYAFTWGFKMEATATWFGMFLSDGARLGAVDVMTELWSGTKPVNLAPVIESLLVDGDPEVDPGKEVRVHASVADPENRTLNVRWVLRPEANEYFTGGDFRPNLPSIEGVIVKADEQVAILQMPDEPGPYRLFMYAYDPAGNAATASIPLRVIGEVRTRFPVSVYEGGFEGMPWAPSGWMGGVELMTLDGANTDIVHDGTHAIRIRYTGIYGWVGVAWQNPPDNWGDSDGGFNLTGAAAVELWARGEYGGEKVTFGVGILDKDRDYPDSAIVKSNSIELTSEWRRFEIDLRGEDLSSLKTGFVVTLQGRQSPVTIYLDTIRYIR